jgi:N-acetylmuramoyl-L-alanine amidase
MGKTGGKTGTDSFGAGIRNDLGILKTNKIPGCLIECGFYDNPNDLQKLKNPTEIVQAICDGIINWFNNMSI